MEKLVLVGGGGHCKSVLDTVLRLKIFDDIVITDPEMVGEEVLGCKIVGCDELLPDLFDCGYKNAVITVGSIKDTNIRRSISNKLIGTGFSFPNIIDCSAEISDNAKLDQGIFVGKNAVINCGCGIKRFAIINTGAIIEHDCSIGEFTHIAVGAVICGGCEIGNDVLIGANSTVIQGIRIGNNCIIGAGSLILSDVPDGSTIVGVWRGKK